MQLPKSGTTVGWQRGLLCKISQFESVKSAKYRSLRVQNLQNIAV